MLSRFAILGHFIVGDTRRINATGGVSNVLRRFGAMGTGFENGLSSVSQKAALFRDRRFGGIFKIALSILLLALIGVFFSLNYNFENIITAILQFSPAALAAVFVALLANALLAALRFKVISGDIGHPIRFRHAIAAVSGGSLAGLLFLQIGGLLMARGFVMARANIPFASVVVVTIYERVIAAGVSGLLALAGAYYVFGNVYLDEAAGGGNFIKILIGLFAAVAAGAWLGYGQMAANQIRPFITRKFIEESARLIALTVLVQLPMMIAYILCVKALSPQTSVFDLVATSSIVMFAASLPISFAGWGVRELSAVFALSAVGISPQHALVAAVTVGIGSLSAMTILAAVSFPLLAKKSAKEIAISGRQRGAIQYSVVLAWALPLAVATLVFFQIYLPIGSGTILNVNLADPLAILCGVLFVINCLQSRSWPEWRIGRLNSFLIAMTAVMTLSLFLGAVQIGWTRWAVVNRFAGWFILLAYAGAGALIANEGNRLRSGEALQVLLKTFVGSGVAIAFLEILLVLFFNSGLRFYLPLVPDGVEGFSLNHNFFAFQLLMAFAASMIVIRRSAFRLSIFTILFCGIVASSSRSGMIALSVMVAIGIYLKEIRWGEVAIALFGVCGLALTFVLVHVVAVGDGTIAGVPVLLVSEQNTAQRLASIFGGLKMFLAHPIFGAGLGAFRETSNIPSHSSQPLLIHSTAVWLLAELGVVGLAAFLSPAILVLRSEFKRRADDQVAKLIILVLIGFGVMSLPADMLYQRTMWLILGAALATLPRNFQSSGVRDEARR